MYSAARKEEPRMGGHLGEVIARAATFPGESVARTAIELLELAPADAVLELGCGSGRALAAVTARLRRGFAAGIDPSELMVRHARVRNRRSIAQGRALVAQGASDDLGRFADGRFDKVFGTHVVYFWMDPARDLAEIRRVLRPGGALVLGFFPSDDGTQGRTRWPVERAVRFLGKAGFTEIGAELRRAGGQSLAWLKGVRS
jgi:SAM-dependent methyltransferase